MNAGRDVERLIADWLVAEAPARAPDRILDDAGRTIDRTKQRRLGAAWRDTMTISVARLAAAAAVIVVAIVGAGVVGRATAGIGNGPSIAPSTVPASPAPTPSPSTALATATPAPTQALADGRYATAPRQAAAAIAIVNNDPSLSAKDKADIIKNVLGLDKISTYVVTIELRAGRLTMFGAYDGGPPIVVSEAIFTSIDDHTFVLREEGQPMSGFQVVRTPSGFTLDVVTAPANAEDALVSKVLFDSVEFSPEP